jgi:ABC-2 type transport system ATP-binding protein
MDSGSLAVPAARDPATGDRRARRDPAIAVSGLRKSYNKHEALRGIDLEVDRGEIFALLGPNGAGKTTTVEILEGYRDRDSGTVSVLGYDPHRERSKLKPRIGIVLQSSGMDRYLSVGETLTMYGGYYPHPRGVDEVIALVGLEEKAGERVLRLSGGQQRRLDVAIALMGDPDLLFLDEPTTGFDPSARREAWEVVRSLAALGKTVLLTTHYMDEAQHLAGRLAVIAGGRVVAEGTPATLAGRSSAPPQVVFRLPDGIELPRMLRAEPVAGGRARLVTEDLAMTLHALSSFALEQGFDLDDLEIVRPSLEDVYLELTREPPVVGKSEH